MKHECLDVQYQVFFSFCHVDYGGGDVSQGSGYS